MSNIIFTILSATFLITGSYLYRKKVPLKTNMIIFFILAFSSILLFITYGVANYFTGNGIDEAVLYHLEYGLEGAGFLEYGLLMLITLILLSFTVFYLFKFTIKKSISTQKHNLTTSSILSLSLLTSLIINPATIDIYTLQGGFETIHETEGISATNKAQAAEKFHLHLRKPIINKAEGKQKNVVFIYAESLERTYFDTSIFPGLINGLRIIESKSTSFTNIKPVPGSGWTVGGMTASQCGIPLFTPSHGNSMSGMDQFLSSATCLGDLLKESGYQLNYMGGADLNFAGKGKLYKTHGFTNIQGRDELVENLKDSSYKTSWGLYDDSLFEMVFNRYIKLSESNEKFGLFTLTLDTHHPKGHPSKSCDNIKYKDGSNPILNAVACSDYLISNFINKVIESPHASNTIIVLASDHLAMRNTAFDLLRSKKNRRNLFMIIDPSKIEFNEIKTLGSSLDIGTTLLPFLGFDGDINLGRNLLNSKELEKERSFIHSQLRTWRPLISEFWDFPKITNSLTVDIQNEQMSIDNRTFRIPAYIELNNELQSTLKFQFNTPSRAKSLLDYRKKIDNNKSFILIDECKNARNLSKTLGKKGFCLLAGKGSKYTKMLKLNTNITYSVDEIEKLIKLTQKTN